MPILEVFRHYPREVFTAMGARFAENVSYYIFTIVDRHLRDARGSACRARSCSMPCSSAPWCTSSTIPIWGALSDRFGRRPVYLFGAVGVGVWAFAFICAARHAATSP